MNSSRIQLFGESSKNFYHSSQTKASHSKNIFNNAPIHGSAIAMKTSCAFTGYQQLNLRQIRILRCGQPIVDFDAAQKCCLYVTTMEAMNFQDDIP